MGNCVTLWRGEAQRELFVVAAHMLPGGQDGCYQAGVAVNVNGIEDSVAESDGGEAQ